VPAFVTAMNTANALGKPLEGIIVLKLTSSSPNIDDADIPLGINVKGTMVFRFPAGTDPLTKIAITAAINVNKASLASWVPANESTYTTGYPPVFSVGTTKHWEVDISPTYDNFTQSGDMPGVMFENGVVDMHGPLNVCGAFYGPSFIELENKTSGNVQYINGIVIGGAGVYVEGNSSAGYQGFKFSPDMIDQLQTYQNRFKTLVRTRFTILR